MEENTSKLLNKINGYKTRIKELHWYAPTMSSHELCDKVADSLSAFEDSIAEEMQTIAGQTVKPGEITCELPKAVTLKEFLAELLKDVYEYYNTLSDPKYVGTKSVVESFIHDVNVFDYLSDKVGEEKPMEKRSDESSDETATVQEEGRKIIVRESSLRRAMPEFYHSLLESQNSGVRVSGSYELRNGSVFIDEDQDFISIKNKAGKEIYHAQGETVWNLINTVFKPNFEDKTRFEAFLAQWLDRLYRENGGE